MIRPQLRNRTLVMRVVRLVLPCIAATLCVEIAVQQSNGQGYAADEAAERMTVAEGLRVDLVASEPLVRQPVAIDFDNRGRLWVIQYLQYPNPAGLERVKWDRYSRTTYDRMPKPPPHGPRGADRLSILEDRDGDGQYDSAKDFVDGLNLATGFAFGHGGVFVLQVPYLLFYADRNNDDVPDGDPEVLLTGFGMQDAHSVANSLTWGPDGWLYGAQGSTVTANIRGIEFQQGVWRYHPRSKRFELFYEGGGNTWGVDFDERGHLFASTNVGGNVLLHGVQGGYYWKSFGKHGALHNPHAYGYFDHVSHENLSGGHVTVGGTIYEGETFPEKYRGAYVGANLLSHAVYWHTLNRQGSTFRGRQQEPLLDSGDTWFAPSDLTVGPDGAIYVADWHDQRTAHPDPDAEWDRTNGRIVRIGTTAETSPPAMELENASSAELIELLASSNDWFRRRARVLLSERQDESVAPLLRRRLDASDEAPLALQYLWALEVSGSLDDTELQDLLQHPLPDVRRWAVRLSGDRENPGSSLTTALVELAASESDVDVRSQLASTAKRQPVATALDIVRGICKQDLDLDDPQIPLLLWWAIEQLAISDMEEVAAFFADDSLRQSKLANQVLLPKIMRRWVAENSDSGFAATATLWLDSTRQEDRGKLLESVAEGLPISKIDQRAAPLKEAVAGEWADSCTDPQLIGVLSRLGHEAAIERARNLIKDNSLDLALRLAMIDLLGSLNDRESLPQFLDLVDDAESDELSAAAIRALARFNDEPITATLLEKYVALPATLRREARALFFARPAATLVFLAAVDRGDVTSEDVTIDQLQQAALHQVPAIDQLIAKHWGRIAGASAGEKLAEVRRLNNDLNAGPGAPDNGHQLFLKHCGVCHRLFNEGQMLGPDLTAANRTDRAYLLEHIIDPTLLVRKEHMNYTVQLADGRVLVGIVVDQSPASITLADEKNVRTVVGSDEIEAMEPHARSLMPERLLEKLTPQELRDLFSYLQLPQPPEGSETTASAAP